MGTFDIKNDRIKYIKNNLLKPYSIAISLKSEIVNSGDMSDNDEKNTENKQVFFGELNIEDRNHIHNKQIHSSIILPADNRNDCDGIYSSNYSNALYILTADCYNIFFSTDNGKTFGVVHAGWKGVLKGIIDEMAKMFKGESKVIIAQGICEKHFIVDDDVKSLFVDKYSDKYCSLTDNNKTQIDIRQIINDSLKPFCEISNMELCNVCEHELLFSYRNGDVKERNMAIIWRENE